MLLLLDDLNYMFDHGEGGIHGCIDHPLGYVQQQHSIRIGTSFEAVKRCNLKVWTLYILQARAPLNPQNTHHVEPYAQPEMSVSIDHQIQQLQSKYKLWIHWIPLYYH